jgi:hypothetical protein
MNLNKYVYVSPQQYFAMYKEWHYDYVVDGVIKRSGTFGYHDGKDTYKKIEREAWKLKKEARKLNQWEWSRLFHELRAEPIYSQEGHQIRFFSKKQQQRFDIEISAKDSQVKIIRQSTDGVIVLNHFYEDEGKVRGYAVIIGPRGGIRSVHGYSVGIDEGEPYLTKSLGSLFD